MKNFTYDLKVTARCLIPMIIISTGAHLLEWRRQEGAVILAAIEIAMLFVIAWMLKWRFTTNDPGTILLLPVGFLLFVMNGQQVSDFVYSSILASTGEEIFYRGYIQSRLNEGFGRPHNFFGIKWGWGVIITSFLFGFMHFMAFSNPLRGYFFPWSWWWWYGFWTFFAGLIFGVVREKTGSIVAPALLHGIMNFLFIVQRDFV